MRPHWLNNARIRFYSGVMLSIFLALAFGLVWFSNLVDPKGYTIISDLTVFWTAAQSALGGHAVQAYRVTDLHESVAAIFPNVKGDFGWFYPPSFFLCILPLGYLPYVPAYLAFMLPTLFFYVMVIRHIVWNREVGWALASFSGVWLNLLRGQNGFLTAAFCGSGLALFERRPLLSGLVIGLTTVKPHLSLLFPVALVASRAWPTLLMAGISSSAIMVAGIGVLGVATVPAWLNSLNVARTFAEHNGPVYWVHMPTMFSFLRLLGVSVPWAYAGHLVVASIGVASVWHVWRRCSEPTLRFAVLATATLLISPYLLEYDLTWLALPAAWLCRFSMREGWGRGERELIVLMWLLPLLSGLLAKWTLIQIGPWVLLLVLGMLLKRVREWQRAMPPVAKSTLPLSRTT